jgi:hypothetical protein
MNTLRKQFDPVDSTDAIQKAIDSGARRVVIPYTGRDWVVRPLRLASNQRIEFAPGVVLTAKPGAFHGKYDCLFAGDGVLGVALQGYGATLRMRKGDYVNPAQGYTPSEHRHAIALRGAMHTVIQGLAISHSGGDGLYVASDAKNHSLPCEYTRAEDCTFVGNHRQGISIISARNAAIDNCLIRGTWGAQPGFGIALECNRPVEQLSGIRISDCVADDNAGGGCLVYLGNTTSESPPVDIRFERCLVRNSPGIAVASMECKTTPGGCISFSDCVVESQRGPALKTRWKTGSGPRLGFDNCHFQSADGIHPLNLEVDGRGRVSADGGMQFEDCYAYQTNGQRVLDIGPRGDGLWKDRYDVIGDITVVGPPCDSDERLSTRWFRDLKIIREIPKGGA